MESEIATVLRCFTNHPGINPVTRARVFQIAAEIGYAHLEKRTTNTRKKAVKITLGVLICSDEEECNRTDYQNPSYLRIEKLRRLWSGMLLVYPFPEPVLDQLVSLVEQFDDSGIDCVDVDHY